VENRQTLIESRFIFELDFEELDTAPLLYFGLSITPNSVQEKFGSSVICLTFTDLGVQSTTGCLNTLL